MSFLYVFIGFALSLVISLMAIPKVISWVRAKNLVDNPNERSAHSMPTPTMGGIGIFAALFLPIFVLLFDDIKYVLVIIAFLITFYTGVVDDLRDISPMKKMAGQFIAALLLALAGFRIYSFYGLFGVEEIPIFLQYIITVIGIIGITNAFNLIDGVDGLTGGIVLINAFIFGVVFVIMKEWYFAILSFSMVGAYLGFLIFNFHPAKIFMGDCGSLVAGLLMCLLALHLFSLELNTRLFHIEGQRMVLFVVGLMFLPVFDFIRVVIYRIKMGKGPMQADKSHAHHLLLNEGLNHKTTALTLYGIHVFLVSLSLVMYVFPLFWALALLFVVGFVLMELFDVRSYHQMMRDTKQTEKLARDQMESNNLLWKGQSQKR